MKNQFSRQYVDSSRLPQTLVEKWSEPILAEGFVPFPKRLLRTMHQFFTGPQAIEELTVVLAIVDFKRPNLTRLPSLSYLAFVSGLEESEFRDTLSRLERKGFARIKGTPEGLDVSLDGLLDEILVRSAKRESVEGNCPSDADIGSGVPAQRPLGWSDPSPKAKALKVAESEAEDERLLGEALRLVRESAAAKDRFGGGGA